MLNKNQMNWLAFYRPSTTRLLRPAGVCELHQVLALLEAAAVCCICQVSAGLRAGWCKRFLLVLWVWQFLSTVHPSANSRNFFLFFFLFKSLFTNMKTFSYKKHTKRLRTFVWHILVHRNFLTSCSVWTQITLPTSLCIFWKGFWI